MKLKTVTVFGASGRQGQAQVRALLRAGFSARAVSRQKSIFADPTFAGAIVMAADYADVASLNDVCRDADAVFFQAPQAERPDRVLQFAQNVVNAARSGGVQRIVLNSTMWSPDEPCGQPMYDFVLMIENIIAGSTIPFVILRPTVFMDNWLTAFCKPALVNERKYRYPHQPDLQYSPISLGDLAKFMVKALTVEAWNGQRLRVAGPQTLMPAEVAQILSESIGVPITYEYQSPLEFGYHIFELVGAGTGLDRDTYAKFFADFYEFNNNAAQKPFFYDVHPLLERVPMQLETFREWARSQDWTALDDAVGSASR